MDNTTTEALLSNFPSSNPVIARRATPKQSPLLQVGDCFAACPELVEGSARNDNFGGSRWPVASGRPLQKTRFPRKTGF